MTYVITPTPRMRRRMLMMAHKHGHGPRGRRSRGRKAFMMGGGPFFDGRPKVGRGGVRIAILHAYPNAISLKEVEPDYVYVPWLNMIILVVLLVGFIWFGVKMRHLFGKAKAKLSRKPEAS